MAEPLFINGQRVARNPVAQTDPQAQAPQNTDMFRTFMRNYILQGLNSGDSGEGGSGNVDIFRQLAMQSGNQDLLSPQQMRGLPGGMMLGGVGYKTGGIDPAMFLNGNMNGNMMAPPAVAPNTPQAPAMQTMGFVPRRRRREPLYINGSLQVPPATPQSGALSATSPPAQMPPVRNPMPPVPGGQGGFSGRIGSSQGGFRPMGNAMGFRGRRNALGGF